MTIKTFLNLMLIVDVGEPLLTWASADKHQAVGGQKRTA